MNLLTIYVPTFDRPDDLERCLASIPAHEDVTVVVSDDSGERAFEQVAVGMGVTYSPRNYNVGRDANLLRSVAICETPWLWVMGDDDWLLPGALDQVLDVIGKDDCDRIIGYSREAADRVAWTGTADADQVIEELRGEPSLLIAATLISANVFRLDSLDLAEGVRRFDTYYAYAWASVRCKRWTILDEPIIGVGTEHANSVPGARDRWREYLDVLCDTNGVPRIPLRDATHWNFVTV